MPLPLKSIVLKRFHSVLSQRLELSNPTFLVGCNGSGKSNLVDAFAFLSEITEFPLQTVIDRRGGINSLITRRPGEKLRPKMGRWTLVSDEGEITPTFGIRVDFEGLGAFSRGQTDGGYFAFEAQCLLATATKS
jgi:predicted ATPase